MFSGLKATSGNRKGPLPEFPMDPRGVPNFPYEKPRCTHLGVPPPKKVFEGGYNLRHQLKKSSPHLPPKKKQLSQKSSGSVTGISGFVVAGSAQQPIDTSAFAGNLRGTEASLQPKICTPGSDERMVHLRIRGPLLEEEKFHHLKQNYHFSGWSCSSSGVYWWELWTISEWCL